MNEDYICAYTIEDTISIIRTGFPVSRKRRKLEHSSSFNVAFDSTNEIKLQKNDTGSSTNMIFDRSPSLETEGSYLGDRTLTTNNHSNAKSMKSGKDEKESLIVRKEWREIVPVPQKKNTERISVPNKPLELMKKHDVRPDSGVNPSLPKKSNTLYTMLEQNHMDCEKSEKIDFDGVYCGKQLEEIFSPSKRMMIKSKCVEIESVLKQKEHIRISIDPCDLIPNHNVRFSVDSPPLNESSESDAYLKSPSLGTEITHRSNRKRNNSPNCFCCNSLNPEHTKIEGNGRFMANKAEMLNLNESLDKNNEETISNKSMMLNAICDNRTQNVVIPEENIRFSFDSSLLRKSPQIRTEIRHMTLSPLPLGKRSKKRKRSQLEGSPLSITTISTVSTEQNLMSRNHEYLLKRLDLRDSPAYRTRSRYKGYLHDPPFCNTRSHKECIYDKEYLFHRKTFFLNFKEGSP